MSVHIYTYIHSPCSRFLLPRVPVVQTLLCFSERHAAIRLTMFQGYSCTLAFEAQRSGSRSQITAYHRVRGLTSSSWQGLQIVFTAKKDTTRPWHTCPSAPRFVRAVTSITNKTDLFQARNVLDPYLSRYARRVKETDLRLVRLVRRLRSSFAKLDPGANALTHFAAKSIYICGATRFPADDSVWQRKEQVTLMPVFSGIVTNGENNCVRKPRRITVLFQM